MATVSQALPEPLTEILPSGFPEFRITTARFREMIALGVFKRGERVFLWHGKLVEKMSKGRPHAYAVMKLTDWIGPLLPPQYHREVEQPLDLADGTRPEPDLMVIRGPLDDYQTREPTSEDLVLVVEVADSTVTADRKISLPDYARASIPVFWLINIPQRRVEVYTEPSGATAVPSYAVRTDYEAETEIPLVIDGRELGQIGVRVLIPRREA